MIEKEFSECFAREWIDSWNSHDLQRILSHYSDDFEMSSPVIIQIAGEPSGILKGKNAVGAHWVKALQLMSSKYQIFFSFKMPCLSLTRPNIHVYYTYKGGV